MKTSALKTSESSATAIRAAIVILERNLFLDPAQHLPGRSCGLRAGDSVNAHHQKKLRIVRGREYHGKAVAGRPPGVSAHRRTRFRERVGKRESPMHFRASSVLRRLGHAVENFTHPGLLALANQFEVSASHT